MGFDDIWNAFLTAIRVVFMDHWMLSMWYVQDGYHKVLCRLHNPRLFLA